MPEPLTFRVDVNLMPLMQRVSGMGTEINEALKLGVKELTTLMYKDIDNTLPHGVNEDLHGKLVTRFHGQVVSGVFQGKVVGPIEARVLETGRRANRLPPVDEIAKWARGKISSSIPQHEIESIAWVIKVEGSPKRRKGGPVVPYHAFRKAAAEGRSKAMGIFHKYLVQTGVLRSGPRPGSRGFRRY